MCITRRLNYFGLSDPLWLDQVVQNWFDEDREQNLRWPVIHSRLPRIGRVLDMAAGCGTFLLCGLKHGQDVWGVEPEGWKRKYFRLKIEGGGYPARFLEHLLPGVGEGLPFKDQSSTWSPRIRLWSTCRTWGAVSTKCSESCELAACSTSRAPDYNGFFEPHYRIFFLPRMNRRLAGVYLRLLRKPLLGLRTLQWVTQKEVVRLLQASGRQLRIERTNAHYDARRREKIATRLPRFLRKTPVPSFLNQVYGLRYTCPQLIKVGREESHIDLWVTRTA